MLAPIHPGEILREEFLRPNGLSAGAAARAMGVPRTRIERLVDEKVDLTPDTALRLARLFETTPDLWMAMQARYAIERTQDDLKGSLEKIVPLRQAG